MYWCRFLLSKGIAPSYILLVVVCHSLFSFFASFFSYFFTIDVVISCLYPPLPSSSLYSRDSLLYYVMECTSKFGRILGCLPLQRNAYCGWSLFNIWSSFWEVSLYCGWPFQYTLGQWGTKDVSLRWPKHELTDFPLVWCSEEIEYEHVLGLSAATHCWVGHASFWTIVAEAVRFPRPFLEPYSIANWSN